MAINFTIKEQFSVHLKTKTARFRFRNTEEQKPDKTLLVASIDFNLKTLY